VRQSRRYRGNFSAYYVLRKWSTPAHWAFGIFCGLLVLKFWPLSIILMVGFALWENWNDMNTYVNGEGDIDWHEAFAAFVVTLVVIFFANLAGVVSVAWWGPVH